MARTAKKEGMHSMDLCSRVLQVMIAGTLLILPATSESRDWFVRAVNMGEDDSQERPFVDPWQALDKLEEGKKLTSLRGNITGKLLPGRNGNSHWLATDRKSWRKVSKTSTAPPTITKSGRVLYSIKLPARYLAISQGIHNRIGGHNRVSKYTRIASLQVNGKRLELYRALDISIN